MRRLFCLQYNMAPFLVEDLIAPALHSILTRSCPLRSRGSFTLS
jgi:hypothetical protein